ncbi:MAG: signal peptidase I [Candidatus Ancillula sp.]|nr:signal peptidase I [Candidatus Ancillula sp.]
MDEDKTNEDLHSNKYSEQLESVLQSLGIDEQDDVNGQLNSSFAHQNVADPIADLENSLTVLNQKKFSSLSNYAQLNAKLDTPQKDNATADPDLLFATVIDKTNKASQSAIETVNSQIDALHNVSDTDFSGSLDRYDASVNLLRDGSSSLKDQLQNEHSNSVDQDVVSEHKNIQTQTQPEITSADDETTGNVNEAAVSSSLANLLNQDVSVPVPAPNEHAEKSFIKSSVLINAYAAAPVADTIETKEDNMTDYEYDSNPNDTTTSSDSPVEPEVTNSPVSKHGGIEISRKEVRKDYNSRVAKTFVKDIVIVIISAVILSVVIKSFIIQPFLIPSSSMSETLQIDDKILVNKVSKHFSSIKRGEVIVFKDSNGWTRNHLANSKNKEPSTFIGDVLKFIGLKSEDDESYLVKRVIGISGDHVSCKGSGEPIYINNKELPREPYIYKDSNPSDKAFDVTVPDGMFFVMGDNRSVSADSRYNTDKPGKGFVPKDDIVGTVFMRLAPMSRLGTLDDGTKVFDSIPNP